MGGDGIDGVREEKREWERERWGTGDMVRELGSRFPELRGVVSLFLFLACLGMCWR